MDARLTSLLFATAFCSASASAQSLDAKFRDNGPAAVQQKLGTDGPGNGIRLNPASRFNTRPEDVASRLAAGLTRPARNVTTPTAATRPAAAPAKIAAAANVADSLVIYGVVKPTPDEPTELTPYGHYSFHAAPVMDMHAESNGQSLPEGFAYIRMGDKYYITNLGVIAEVDAFTGETLRTAALQLEDGSDMTPLQLGTYDPLTGKIYFGAWGADWSQVLFALDPETLAYEQVGSFDNTYPLSLAAAPDGKLYTIIYPSSLYAVDKETCEMTLISENAKAGESDYQNATAAQSAAVDWSTGKLYLTNLDQKWRTHLTQIDLTTGEATHIAEIPGNDRIIGLYIPTADAAAPGFAHHISYADGKLLFTAPSKTYDGSADLSGTLTAIVCVDGTETAQLSVTPGQAVEHALELADGAHTVEISMANEAGTSPFRRLNAFVGNDMPQAVVNLTLNADDGQHLTLTWEAPTTSQHGGPVDDDAISYRVTRFPDNVVVADGLKELTFSEQIPERHAHYYYTVTACAYGQDGPTATTNVLPAGSTIILPYTETFDTQADFDFYKVVDNNNDAATWQCMLPYGSDSGYAYMNGQYEGGDDDYLITPSIKLQKGVDYKVAFDTYDQWMLEEHITLLLGTSQELKGNEVQIAESTLQPNGHYEFIFNVKEDGLYNLLLHGDTQGTSINISLDNLALSVHAAFEGPAAVGDLQAKAGEKGALDNTLTFTAPTQTYQGGTLAAIDRIEVYRNDGLQPAKVFSAPTPGEQLSWLDTDVAQGSVTYRIVPFNAAGQGQEARVTNWVGLDVPAEVTNLKARMDENFHAVATWDQVGEVGAHGGYVNPADVKYVLKRYNQFSWDNPYELVSDSTTAFTLTDETFTPLWGERQSYVDYLVVACNSAGASAGEPFGIVLGEPYENPYAESFADGFASQNPWTLFANSYYYAWNFQTGSGLAVKPYDGDNGMLQFSLIAEDSNDQTIAGPRVSLEGMQKPELSFYLFHGFEAEPGDLTLKVYTNYDDEGWKLADEVDYNNGSEGWSRYSLPLRTDAHNLQIAFGAYAADQSASLYIDHIAVAEGVDNELAIEGIRADKRIAVGTASNIEVSVSNYGMETARDFTVKLYKDGEAFAEQTVASLEKNTTAHVTFDFVPALTDAAKTFVFNAELVADKDTEAGNNASGTVKVYVKGSSLPAPGALTGENLQREVVLSWQAPATDEQQDAATDDFESYETFIIDNIGDWAVYDGDGCIPVYFGGPEVPNAFVEKAWQIWAPEEAGFSVEKFPVLTPHSGSKYATCWAASDGVSQTLPNDDWLISPDVVGGTDVSFWYRMPNEGSDPQVFEMMYSSTDREVESFEAFDRDSIMGSTEWKHFEYTLPKDAKYFAIRSCCKGSYTVALLDDITFTPLYGSKSKLTLKGYNVYRDNQLIAEGVTTCTFTDEPELNKAHTYTVTAVWAEGESNCTNTFEGLVTAIDPVDAAAAPQVFALPGRICIDQAANRAVSVCNAAGQVIFSTAASAEKATLRVMPGVYMVTLDGRTLKVIVR